MERMRVRPHRQSGCTHNSATWQLVHMDVLACSDTVGVDQVYYLQVGSRTQKNGTLLSGGESFHGPGAGAVARQPRRATPPLTSRASAVSVTSLG